MRLSDFEGRWRMSRTVRNTIGPDATFEGLSVFAPDPGGLILTETGEMRIEGQGPMRASRRYLWRETATGLEVFFEDGRFFHRVAGGDAPGTRHHCAPDIYEVAYDFSQWPLWSTAWRVTGPRKDYGMVARYAPVTGPT
ncbi:hypothetical protein OB2597_04103 [Pseudooceanicola batsensis HTCC2597]|uniref:DUF6314 domain-containing protein n=1 Tax=Pseudooceanicola batsensis (strain ATCC BAA-863 / DSM 15984 / KCTC 12145 / HTCC2597) TaxID=252305 RepID=A3U2L7_PSEBH|nr:DUF6314 family protein [Pseudooceanicola batsensis]EAQ01591.1 hypothetical protein OB2597_04103 [Pseudooceanicola batsensis HTCC2597]